MPLVTVVNLSRGTFTLPNPFGSIGAGKFKTETLEEKHYLHITEDLSKLEKLGFIAVSVLSTIAEASATFLASTFVAVEPVAVEPVAVEPKPIAVEPVAVEPVAIDVEDVEPVVIDVEPVAVAVAVDVEPVAVEPVAVAVAVAVDVEPVAVEPVAVVEPEPIVEAAAPAPKRRSRR